MTKKFEIKLHQDNVQSELLRSQAIMQLVEDKANAIAGAAEDMSGLIGEYDVNIVPYGSTRSAARVTANTPHARSENLKNNTLLKALGQVQGSGQQ